MGGGVRERGPENASHAARQREVENDQGRVVTLARALADRLGPVVVLYWRMTPNLVPSRLCSRRISRGCPFLKELRGFHGADFLGNRHHKKLIHRGVIGSGDPFGGLFE